MHRIDTSTATPDHKFTEGDPTVPVAATTVSAAWLNAVQEELVATITKAGLELEKSDNGQLAAAIAKLISTAVDAVRVSPATTVPKAPGTAATGSSAKYAREDHVHPVQTSVSGSAGSAAKLSTARTILVNLASTTAGSFDGTKNITPGVSGTLPTARGGTGRTDGKAAALATARTITLSGDVTGNVSFDGSKNVTIQTTVASLGGAVPIGGIIPFSGTFGGEGNRFPIPLGEDEPLSNWCLCDGTTTNDLPVPDLRGRMILGVSTTYKAGSKGGSASHTHSLSGTVGDTTLTEAQVAKHRHSMSMGDGNNFTNIRVQARDNPERGTNYTGYTGGSQPHTHTLDGASGSANSLPPYYALSYIMRVS